MSKKEGYKEKKINVEGADNQQQEKAQNEAAEDKQAQEEATATDKSDSKEEAEEPKDPLKAAQDEIADLKDKYLRAVAEFDNYKKRTLKEKAELILNGGEKTITAILPVLDDMERAVENAGKAESKEKLEEGWELIFKKLQKTLESLGVKPIDTKDADFNVDFHEAVAMVPGMGDDKKGKVVDCIQTGYMLNDKVIRHAKVAVGQ